LFEYNFGLLPARLTKMALFTAVRFTRKAALSSFERPASQLFRGLSQRQKSLCDRALHPFRSVSRLMTTSSAVDISVDSIPSNLNYDDFENLVDEPVPIEEKLLLSPDDSEKVLSVIKLSSDVYSQRPVKTEPIETVTLDNRVFGVPIRRDIVHNVVVWQRARWRRGTGYTKTRAETRGGGKRPWRQKGTGRARHGSIRSPLWRGGGKAHGKKKRDFSFKLNRKVRALGMRVALASKWREGNLFIVDTDSFTTHKTKDFVAALEDAGFYEEEGSVMLVDGDKPSENLKLATQNIPWMTMYPQIGANVYAIVKHHRLFLTRDALELLTERLTRTLNK
jgi:large subunit ribosomal protein L4